MVFFRGGYIIIKCFFGRIPSRKHNSISCYIDHCPKLISFPIPIYSPISGRASFTISILGILKYIRESKIYSEIIKRISVFMIRKESWSWVQNKSGQGYCLPFDIGSWISIRINMPGKFYNFIIVPLTDFKEYTIAGFYFHATSNSIFILGMQVL